MIPILRLVHILYTVEFVYSEQAYNEVKINPNRYLNNVFLKAYYEFFLTKIRLITKIFFKPKQRFYYSKLTWYNQENCWTNKSFTCLSLRTDNHILEWHLTFPLSVIEKQ